MTGPAAPPHDPASTLPPPSANGSAPPSPPPPPQAPVRASRVMSTGAGIFLITTGAILRFALPAGSPLGLNVHMLGVVLILAGGLGLLLPRIARAMPRDRLRIAHAAPTDRAPRDRLRRWVWWQRPARPDGPSSR
jgi:hypothetical protein